ncbi:glutathione peroxidase [Thalassococcus sp. CAU 1522]|uniref:Glutathione peroxidase n=1 Tax=Thalassococcus arenae TaxID=2851652 RepID=A0ABS6N3Y0_9RHOB|nr:glutathione peroxidase [Thalassococcus arenae]MBV2358215.1 glutathione peroxidase [Thalassococcus arenae]
MKRLAAAILALFSTLSAAAAFEFDNIDGGTLDMSDWAGRPVLVVNTASQCAFTRQYSELQALYDRYRDRGLVVLAVPSDDFRQELDSAEVVKEFCEVNFGLTLPMTDITPVSGPQAHPFYRFVQETAGFAPRWNFNKVLIGPDGAVVATWGSAAKPLSRSVTDRIEPLLN